MRWLGWGRPQGEDGKRGVGHMAAWLLASELMQAGVGTQAHVLQGIFESHRQGALMLRILHMLSPKVQTSQPQHCRPQAQKDCPSPSTHQA